MWGPSFLGQRPQVHVMGVTHPNILDQITILLIQDFDQRLHHPGPERLLPEIRHQYWVLHGQEAIRRHQHSRL